jgi:hypothetical protein
MRLCSLARDGVLRAAFATLCARAVLTSAQHSSLSISHAAELGYDMLATGLSWLGDATGVMGKLCTHACAYIPTAVLL